MTQWTSQQLKCLEAIGVPVYAHVPRMLKPGTETDTGHQPAKAADTAGVTATTTYYKLGPWVFEFNETIPVESYDWLRDLAAYCQSTPAQVSPSDKTVCLKKYAKNQLSAADKKELWQLLKASI